MDGASLNSSKFLYKNKRRLEYLGFAVSVVREYVFDVFDNSKAELVGE